MCYFKIRSILQMIQGAGVAFDLGQILDEI
jgi:hypothetical protein